MDITILAIESSCDETAAAISKNGKILANQVASQEVHAAWGGVVPELASRAHQQQIVPVVHAAMQEAGVKPADLSAIAFTRGPGLLGALLVGTSFAKGMSIALHKPLIEVNHMEAHVLANFIEHQPQFPFLCLTVSGGHTQIVLVKAPLQMEVIGKTIDDAAGEAFDKSAKIFGLPYPGGPLLDKLAREGKPSFGLPFPQVGGLDFSFSGIKTAVLYLVRDQTALNPEFVAQNLNDLCASVQEHLCEYLLRKVRLAVKQTGVKEIALAGGVSANSRLREKLREEAVKKQWTLHIPSLQYCTDNAGMIAMAAHFKYLEGVFCLPDVEPLARYPVGS
jgi:N6-L-threonylcarbamoyladenine synthase